jgi:hypothetical protein
MIEVGGAKLIRDKLEKVLKRLAEVEREEQFEVLSNVELLKALNSLSDSGTSKEELVAFLEFNEINDEKEMSIFIDNMKSVGQEMNGFLQVFFFEKLFGTYWFYYDSFIPQTSELQKYMIENNISNKYQSLLMSVDDGIAIPEVKLYKMKKMNLHDLENRDSALVYIKYIRNEEEYEEYESVLEGDIHPELVSSFLAEHELEDEVLNSINHRSEAPELAKKSYFYYELAFASLVNVDNFSNLRDSFNDYTEINKAIYIDPLPLVNISLEDAAQKFKAQYRDYPIYVDGEGKIDVENMIIRHKLLIASRMKKIKNAIWRIL